MSRLFTSERCGAAVYVFSDDHCPPHVHARNRGDGWIARVSFSYLSSVMELMNIEPLKNIPKRRVVNWLLDDIQVRLPDCRRSWWTSSQKTCLENQWVRVGRPGRIVLSDHVPGAIQIADAQYEPTTERVHVTFRDGTTEEVRLRA